MKADTRIVGLARITGLIMDQHLAELRVRKAAQTATKAHIAALDQRAEAENVEMAAAALAGLRYAAWADGRKAALNLTLAQQTVAVLEAEAGARTAFARNTVMTRLAKT